MYWIKSFLQARKPYVAFAVVVVLSFGLMALSVENKVAVARWVSISTIGVGHWMFSGLIDLFHVRDDNRMLREQNLRLSLELVKIREERLENIRLRDLLGFKSKLKYPYVAAEVIGRDPGRHPNSILINVGRKDGVMDRMAVVTSDGLVGKVLAVHSGSAVVQLLTDRNCRVSGVVQRDDRGHGIVRYEDGKFYLHGFPLRTDIQIGDVVISSGMGGIFPADLPIGTVRELGPDQMGLFQEVILKGCVNFDSIEEVFVLTNGHNLNGSG